MKAKMSTPENHIDPSQSPEEKALYRYLNDEMSNREKYAFERAMEKDPFTYEAIEGLQGAAAKDIAKDLTELRRDLVRAERPSSRNFLKVAAVAALLLLAGFSAWKLTTGTGPGNETISSAGPTMEDPLTNNNEVPAVAALPAEEGGDTLATPEPLVAESRPDTNAATTAAPSPTQTDETLVAVADDEVVDEFAVNTELTFAEEVAEARDPLASQGAGAAEGESIAFQAREVAPEIAQVEVPQLTDINAIAASDDAAGARRLTLADEDVAKKAAASRTALTAEPVTTELATPAGGWEAFRSYVTENQQRTAGMVTGEVRLTFTLDAQGRPQNISVSRALCEPCDQEAIRLLQNSRQWQYNAGVTGTPLTAVTIQISN